MAIFNSFLYVYQRVYHVDIMPLSNQENLAATTAPIMDPVVSPAKHPTSADLHHSAPLPAAHLTISVLAPHRLARPVF